MNLDLFSFLIGVLSSLIAAISVYVTKRAAEKLLSERNTILKNQMGEVREIVTSLDDSEKDIRLYLNEAIKYEELVGEVFKKLKLEFEGVSHTAIGKGYDFLLKDGDSTVAVEVKSHKRPISERIVKGSLSNLPDYIDEVLLVSKNGFSKSSVEYLKKINKNVVLASGDNDELLKSITAALQKKGIRSEGSGQPK